jgi:hypothetical protein
MLVHALLCFALHVNDEKDKSTLVKCRERFRVIAHTGPDRKYVMIVSPKYRLRTKTHLSVFELSYISWLVVVKAID